jgi:hypothetical protein
VAYSLTVLMADFEGWDNQLQGMNWPLSEGKNVDERHSPWPPKTRRRGARSSPGSYSMVQTCAPPTVAGAHIKDLGVGLPGPQKLA